MARSLLRLSLLVFLVSMTSHCQASGSDSGGESCFRLTAAVNYYDDVYLIDGDTSQFILLNSSFHEVRAGTMGDEFGGPDGAVDSALVYHDDDELYFFQGNNYFEYSSFWESVGSASHNSAWGPFFENGIDAAASVHGNSIFFRKCEFLHGDIGGEGHDINEIGLPCDVDAAWGYDDAIYVTKGDEVWIGHGDEDIHGPMKLSDIVTLTSATFCEGEDPHTLKVKAEQAYEKEHECVIIDAAINWYDDVYFFNDDQYLSLDDEGQETGVSPIHGWGGLEANIDAGVLWTGNEKTYFFRGNGYYTYFYYLAATAGPRHNSGWAPFFEEGIDAAGNHDSMSYFFKGCEIVRYEGPKSEVTAVLQAEDLDLPCHADAAFSRGSTLYVVKRDQVWTWRAGEETATGPASLSTVAQLTSWTVCPPESTK